MPKNVNIETGRILLAEDWKLYPIDERNWELCHRYASDHHKAKDNKPRWRRCGRYYSYNTIDQAMLYVVDQLIADGCRDEALTLAQYAAGYRDIVERVVTWFMKGTLG
jgi:hypothetical protein